MATSSGLNPWKDQPSRPALLTILDTFRQVTCIQIYRNDLGLDLKQFYIKLHDYSWLVQDMIGVDTNISDSICSLWKAKLETIIFGVYAEADICTCPVVPKSMELQRLHGNREGRQHELTAALTPCIDFVGSERRSQLLSTLEKLKSTVWSDTTVAQPGGDLPSQKNAPTDLKLCLQGSYPPKAVTVATKFQIQGWNRHPSIIAIEGLGANPFGTFRSLLSNEIWLRDYLPHNTRQTRASRRLPVPARTESQTSESSPGQVLVLSHDRRHTSPESNLLPYSIGFIGYGVPLNGMRNESLLKLVRNHPNYDMIRHICIESGHASPYLRSLASRFRLCNQDVDTYYFFETELSADIIVRNTGRAPPHVQKLTSDRILKDQLNEESTVPVKSAKTAVIGCHVPIPGWSRWPAEMTMFTA
ncbi:hypothetical protein PG984_005359 [Apiospora sp. TS-2023a]